MPKTGKQGGLRTTLQIYIATCALTLPVYKHIVYISLFCVILIFTGR